MINVIGLIFEMVGSLLVAFAVYFVHHNMITEHRFDKKVLIKMRLEQKLILWGMLFLLIGFALQISNEYL